MINLSKGGRVNLSKDDNGNKLSKVFFGANWGAIKSGGFMGFGGGTEAVDLDASVVLMDASKRKLETVYFGHKDSSDRAIHHSGDDLVGDTNGDDGMDNETISVELDRIRLKLSMLLSSSIHIVTKDSIRFLIWDYESIQHLTGVLLPVQTLILMY